MEYKTCDFRLPYTLPLFLLAHLDDTLYYGVCYTIEKPMW